MVQVARGTVPGILLEMAANGECSITNAGNLINTLIQQVDVEGASEIRKALDKIAASQR
jgi:hypothetical protein